VGKALKKGFDDEAESKTIGEVKAMTRAADSMSESVRSGALGLRALVVEAGKAGAEATAQIADIADRKFSEGADEFAKTSRRTRKNFAKKTKLSRQELKKSSAAARKEALTRAQELRAPGRKAKRAAILAAKSAGDSRRRGKKNFKAAKEDFRAAMTEVKSAVKGERRRRRRWPWLIGLGVVAAGAAYASRLLQAPKAEALPPQGTPVSSDKQVSPATQPAATPGTVRAEPAASHNGRPRSSVPGAKGKN
jgi:hypothetical protein